MQGFFDVQVKDAPGLTDEFFNRLTPQELMHLLPKLPTAQHAPWQKNLVCDMTPAWIFRHLMSGGDPGYPYSGAGLNAGGLCNITLLNVDAAPTYTLSSGIYCTIHNHTNTVQGSTAGKRFLDDQVETQLIAPTAGKEELAFRSRWLYTPSQAVSSDIRSVGYFYSDDASNTGNNDRGYMGRVRLKDSGGSPIILNKTAAQVLLIQLILKLVTL